MLYEVITVIALTTSRHKNSKMYQTHPQWTADGKYVVITSDRTSTKEKRDRQAYAISMDDFEITQITTGDRGSDLHLGWHTNSAYLFRGNRLVQLKLDELLADSDKGTVGQPEDYEVELAVVPDSIRPSGLGFRITSYNVCYTKLLRVEVLGTAFNVMAYDGEVPAITLDRGLVRLSSATMAQQLLKPGFQALLDTLDREISISEVDTELYSCWRDHRLVFRNEPLKSVIVKLERWYNVEIEIADSSLLANKVTADIESESVKEVMDLMQVTMPIECSYNKDERKLIIQKH